MIPELVDALTPIGPPVKEANPWLTIYGPLWAFCLFFMAMTWKVVAMVKEFLKTERADDRAAKEEAAEMRAGIREDNRANTAALVRLTHQFEGMRRVLAADLAERESAGPHTREFARREMAKVDAAIAARNGT